ncbi:MAG: TIGR03986 family CRISPR-associated RAMP protein [Bacteroidota bacterium]
MPEIKSTYNFVPAPEERAVYKPKWAKQVSHDVPFSDGESGEIEVTITAKAPMFIRNGYAKGQSETQFSYHEVDGKKQYFIPGTSLKGMIRNVVEIITQSRMNQVNNHRHAVRQIMRTQGTVVDEGYVLAGEEKKHIRAGWLVQKGEEYFVVDCGKPLKVRYTDIDDFFNTDFAGQFGSRKLSGMDSDFSARTAKYKYEELLAGHNMEQRFEDHPLLEDHQQSWVSKFQPLNYVQFSEDTMDGYMGTIVCVGQASAYDVKTARKGEYVFRGLRSELIESGHNRIKLDAQKMEDFRFLNRHNQPDELEDWKYWKKHLEAGIPVFFRKAKDGKSVKDLGLSFMYKQAATYSVKEAYPLASYPDPTKDDYEPDWAETLFGYTNKPSSLKGRIFFGSLFQNGEVRVLPERSVVLSTPRSSFFPFYLKQKGSNGKVTVYNTYNKNPILSGYKRYPIRNDLKMMDTSEMNEDMITSFQPIDQGAIFKGKIRFHNLRAAEIGVLISALTFHGKQDTFFHTIGYGKGLGYGKITLDIKTCQLKEDQTAYLKAFEHEITNWQTDWHQSEAIRELLAMSTPPPARVAAKLDYLNLKDFQAAKNEGNYLAPYSEISNRVFSLEEWLDDVDKANFRRAAQAAALAKQAQIEKEKADRLAALKAEELSAFNRAMELNALEALNDFLAAYPASPHSDSVNQKIAEIRSQKKANKIKDAQQGDFIIDSYKFDAIKQWTLQKYKVKGFKFSDAQQTQLEDAIRKSYALEVEQPKKSKFHKKRKLVPFNKFPWADIQKWIGETRAKALYEELTGQKA